MKVLMLNYEFPPIGGGAANAHLCLLKEYAGLSNLTVDVLTSAPKPGFTVEKFAENISIYKVGIHKKNLHYWRKTEVIEWLFKAWMHYKRLITTNNYNLVHTFFGFPTGLFCYVSTKKLPYIISLRGSDVPGYNSRLKLDYKLLAWLFVKIWYRASVIVANSKGLCKLANEFTPHLNIKVITNGIDTKQFYPPEKRMLTKPIKMLTVGRLISRKRIDLLIKAVALILKTDSSIHFTVAGDGNLHKLLQTLVQELNISKNVTFAGRIAHEKMAQLYRDTDIFIMSSDHEGMSNAMLEAMASGLPIITTRCQGVEELINDNGVVVENANADEIANAITSLIKDPNTYTQMSIAAKKHAKKFSWVSVAKCYAQLYQSIVKE